MPPDTNALVVETMLDTKIVKLGASVTSNVPGALAISDSMSIGVGIISFKGNLPPSFTITVSLEAVANGSSSIFTGNVLDMIGGNKVAGATATSDVDSITVSNVSLPPSTTLGTTMLIGPPSIVGPGKVAVAFSFTEPVGNKTATLNGSEIDFVSNNVGIAIVDIPVSNPINLNLVVNSGTSMTSGVIGNIEVSSNTTGAALPAINSVTVQNKKSVSRLVLTGKKLSKTDTSIVIVPTNSEPLSGIKVMGAVLKTKFDSANCIPKGSYINLSTLGGTAAKKIKVRGTCNNPLVIESE